VSSKQCSRICAALFGLIAALFLACSSDRAPSDDERVGAISMALSTVANGHTYRLTHAAFTISGPTPAALDSDSQPDAGPLTSGDLQVGTYSVQLESPEADPWSLERFDSPTWVPVHADLASPNPVTTVIVNPGATTTVKFGFATDGTIVTFGDTGTISIGIEVIEIDAGSTAESGPSPDVSSPVDASDATTDATIDATIDVASDVADAPTEAEGAVDAGAACIGNVTIDFASLSPYFANVSSTCGAASVSGNALVLQQNGTCNQGVGGWVRLDPSRFRICGDFDIRADFDLTTFTIPTNGSRYAVMKAVTSDGSNSMTLERYDISATNSCVPAKENYKAWTTSSLDCGQATFKPAASVVKGAFRITRVGTTVTGYYLSSGDAGASDAALEDAGTFWTPIRTVTTVTTPWGFELYTGYTQNGGDPAHQTIRFSNLRILSGATP
jgi:hypothetical protein